jgi:hypothetical protein
MDLNAVRRPNRLGRAGDCDLPTVGLYPIQDMEAHERVDLVESFERQYGDVHPASPLR